MYGQLGQIWLVQELCCEQWSPLFYTPNTRVQWHKARLLSTYCKRANRGLRINAFNLLETPTVYTRGPLYPFIQGQLQSDLVWNKIVQNTLQAQNQ